MKNIQKYIVPAIFISVAILGIILLSTDISFARPGGGHSYSGGGGGYSETRQFQAEVCQTQFVLRYEDQIIIGKPLDRTLDAFRQIVRRVAEPRSKRAAETLLSRRRTGCDEIERQVLDRFREQAEAYHPKLTS